MMIQVSHPHRTWIHRLQGGPLFWIPLLVWAACAEDPGASTQKMSVSVQLQSCACQVTRVEMSLVKSRPEGPCRVWQGQGDGTGSLSLKGVKPDPDETYQVGLAAYCSLGSNDRDDATTKIDRSECCADLQGCMGEYCRPINEVCQSCSFIDQSCGDLLHSAGKDLSQLFFDQLIADLEFTCMASQAETLPCCVTVGNCAQSIWTSCASDQCWSCAEATTQCQMLFGEFDPWRLSGQDLFALIINACSNATSEQNNCCIYAQQCLEEAQALCGDIPVGSCPSCTRAMGSCTGSQTADGLNPESAKELYTQLCEDETKPPPEQAQDCVACYALEPLKVIGGETALQVKASAECQPKALTEHQELPACPEK